MASAPPVLQPAPLGPPLEAGPFAAVVSPIEEQAARLARGLDYEAGVGEPSRNPFRFGAPAGVPKDEELVAPPAADVVAPAVARAPFLTLAGIATDLAEDETVRTAIISAPSGIVLAGVGDVVTGGYRVQTIGIDSVQLAGDGDDAILTLLLRP